MRWRFSGNGALHGSAMPNRCSSSRNIDVAALCCRELQLLLLLMLMMGHYAAPHLPQMASLKLNTADEVVASCLGESGDRLTDIGRVLLESTAGAATHLCSAAALAGIGALGQLLFERREGARVIGHPQALPVSCA